MGFPKSDDKSSKRTTTTAAAAVLALPRWIKTIFFLTAMFLSLLVFSAPILLVVADAVLPSAFLSATLSPSLRSVAFHLHNYDFRYSLIDIPLISVLRSAIIFCVYSFCDGPRLSNGPYLAITTACSAASLVFVSFKASYVFIVSGGGDFGRGGYSSYGRAMEVAMFVSSAVLAVAHVVVAYRTSCKERRKMLVYKIDIEAVSACSKGFPRYQKILIQDSRTN